MINKKNQEQKRIIHLNLKRIIWVLASIDYLGFVLIIF